MISIVDQLTILGSGVFAAVLGAILGAERKRAEKPVGMRTHALVAASTAVLVSVGAAVEREIGAGDPTRVMHGIITGIGFLAAGVIYLPGKHRPAIGITTAAGIFATAGVGITVGIGAPLAAAGVTALVLGVLRELPRFEEMWLQSGDSDTEDAEGDDEPATTQTRRTSLLDRVRPRRRN